MKTGTIVAIIVAAVVVVGVCVGIPLSGVLNGTSGTPGDTPVQPTEPPVETPPTPTETPSSTPMSSFSGGGMKSDSGSSSSDPITPPEDSGVLGEQNVPTSGVISVTDDDIIGSAVSEMIMSFPQGYQGTTVTFKAVSETLVLPGNAIMAVDITLTPELPQGESVEFTFTVPSSALGGHGPADVCFYHHGTVWTPLTTTYFVSGTDVIYTAIADDFSPFALVFEENGATAPHEHQWVTKPIEGDKHQEVCSSCGEVKSGSSADCTIVFTSFEGLTPATHNKTCVTCGRDDGGLICGDDGITLVSMAEKPEYHNETCTQCNYVLKSDVSCTIGYKQNGDSTHTVFCKDGCGYEVLDVPCSGEFTHDGTAGHAGTCDNCKQSYTSAQCTSFTYTPAGSGLHTKKCDTCEHEYTGVACDSLEYVSENGSHTQKCVQCEQAVKTEKCSITYEYNGANGVHTHTGVCSVCQKPHTTQCIEAKPQPIPGQTAHSISCSVCQEVLIESEPCTNFEEIVEEGYKRDKCPQCDAKYTTAAVTDAEGLAKILNDFGSAGSGNSVIDIEDNIELTGSWTSINVDGYNGADVITINGNGHYISGLTAPLFSGGFAGGSGIKINGLTIKDSTIVDESDTNQGSGAFIEDVSAMDVIELNNCHLLDSSVSGTRTGGLIGYTAGYSNENDGAVKTYVTITGCSVINCQITGSGTTGGIIGHSGGDSYTITNINNCEIKKCVITTSSTSDNYKGVGIVLGTAPVGENTITKITQSENTVTGAGTNAHEFVGRLALVDTGKLTIDGVSITE